MLPVAIRALETTVVFRNDCASWQESIRSLATAAAVVTSHEETTVNHKKVRCVLSTAGPEHEAHAVQATTAGVGGAHLPAR